ncbi:hypothetical protein [Paenibacillus methanolicus]|uniref:YhcN/YlaJ family sporulation lipoprotein n=1 Tax=Paenibacillus methanolicus TaxID=582686 RepID=A0A5S5CHY5_9BACL|nr:hypothetical protein [Paenibacillus methanolicus]TYP78228.1 hypothetical protein BCM02_102805 [Paenibacillus methanolicus]
MKRPIASLAPLGLLLAVLLVLSACGSGTKHAEHVEVFVAETLEQNEAGFYETTGFKKVNAVTTIEEGKNHVKTDTKTIEDYYDTAGRHMKTEIAHSYLHKSHVTLAEDKDQRTATLEEPAAILIPDGETGPFKMNKMTETEKTKVREHVQSFIDKL